MTTKNEIEKNRDAKQFLLIQLSSELSPELLFNSGGQLKWG